MLSVRLRCALLFVAALHSTLALAQQSPSGVFTLKSTARLVFMDVTVLDKKNHPVVKGLTRDDFTITEDKKPQSIFSFEAPEVHLTTAHTAPAEPPATIFVLDRLNCDFEDFAFLSYSIKKYLHSLPKQLDSPAELMVLGNDSLEMVQNYTRSRDELLDAVDHIHAAIPYKMINRGSFLGEIFVQSMDSLQQIALQNKGVPGRKNIIWLGWGGPGIDITSIVGDTGKLNRYVHDTTNLLVDARMSLFVLTPGVKIGSPVVVDQAPGLGSSGLSGYDPFGRDFSFRLMVNATGGQTFGLNDVDHEIRTTEELGSNFYTLTYQPPDGKLDGKFRNIRVSLRDPGLHVVTKAGYYAPDKEAPADPRRQGISDLSEAAHSTIPFTALDLTVEDLVRHPNSDMVGFTVVLQPHNIVWQPQPDGVTTAQVHLAVASLSHRRDILTSKLASFLLRNHAEQTAASQGPTAHLDQSSHLPVTVRFPRKAQLLRVVVQVTESGRMGAVEVDRSLLDRAPEVPLPEPPLLPRPTPATVPTPQPPNSLLTPQ